MIDVNLTGVWNTVKASVPHMIAADNGAFHRTYELHRGLSGPTVRGSLRGGEAWIGRAVQDLGL